MKKIIKKWGASQVIVLDREDVKILNTEEGDVIDIKEFEIIKKGDK